MKRSRDVVIDLCSTDDEVDAAPPPAKKVAKIAPPAVSQPSTTNGARGGIGGFTPEERRKLEEARAARAAAAVAAGAITVAVQRSIDRPSTVATINTPASAPRASTSTAGSTGLLYPRAVVKPTYNIFAPDDPNAIKVTDLLGDVHRPTLCREAQLTRERSAPSFDASSSPLIAMRSIGSFRMYYKATSPSRWRCTEERKVDICPCVHTDASKTTPLTLRP